MLRQDGSGAPDRGVSPASVLEPARAEPTPRPRPFVACDPRPSGPARGPRHPAAWSEQRALSVVDPIDLDDPQRPRPLARLGPRARLDFTLTFAALHPGHLDPCTLRGPRDLWRAARTPAGPGTLHLFERRGVLGARAFGPGGSWLLARARGVAGLLDRPERFEPEEPRLRRLRDRVRGLRLARTPTVLDTLLPTVLGQRVKVYEARRSWARLARELGEPAPGPAPLVLPPDPRRLADAPGWWWASHGVDTQRARTMVEICRHARRIERTPKVDLTGLLERLPGIGPWTLAHVRLRHLGDPDAVPLGDFNLPHAVGRFFTGRARSTDEEMLAHLAPFAGQRARAIRWIKASGSKRQRFGPKTALRLTP